VGSIASPPLLPVSFSYPVFAVCFYRTTATLLNVHESVQSSYTFPCLPGVSITVSFNLYTEYVTSSSSHCSHGMSVRQNWSFDFETHLKHTSKSPLICVLLAKVPCDGSVPLPEYSIECLKGLIIAESIVKWPEDNDQIAQVRDTGYHCYQNLKGFEDSDTWKFWVLDFVQRPVF
jgi:hypothetical protein